MTELTWLPEFEAYVAQQMTTAKCPGFSMGVAVNGESVYSRGFGYRNREQALPATALTTHGIGSITKSMTAVAIMQLVERGALRVTDPVVQHLPEFRTPDPDHTAKVTLHHLLTHTAGLPPLPFLYAGMKESLEADPSVADSEEIQAHLKKYPMINTCAQLLELMAAHPYELLGAPGERFSYLNEGYALLGAIIERVSGQSYSAFLQENLLDPAGMTSSTLRADGLEERRDVTQLYVKKDADAESEPAPGWWQSEVFLAAGFLRSTVPDMLRYMEIFRTGGMVGQNRILSAESVQRMTAPTIAAGPGMFYGYGLMLTPAYNGVSLVEHGGGVKGVSAYVSCVPERGITAVGLANLGGMGSGQVLLAAINGLLGLPLETKRAELGTYDCPPERLADYVGEYHSGEGARIQVSLVDDILTFEMKGVKPMSAWPTAEDSFAVAIGGNETKIDFTRDAAGQVESASMGFRIVRKVRTA